MATVCTMAHHVTVCGSVQTLKHQPVQCAGVCHVMSHDLRGSSTTPSHLANSQAPQVMLVQYYMLRPGGSVPRSAMSTANNLSNSTTHRCKGRWEVVCQHKHTSTHNTPNTSKVDPSPHQTWPPTKAYKRCSCSHALQ